MVCIIASEPLSRWIEENVRLPAGSAAEPGPIKLYPYQRGIAQAIADPKIERVSVLKNLRGSDGDDRQYRAFHRARPPEFQ